MSATQPKPRPRILEKLERHRAAYRQHGPIYRAAWVTAGVIVVLAGLAMVVFPGPAVVVVPLGLAMLSFEFCWAQRLLDNGVQQGAAVKDKIVEAPTRDKVLGAIGLALALAAAAWVAVAVLT
jgi:tellurite resistance protein TerC